MRGCKRNKYRSVDYSLKELEELTKLTKKEVYDGLKKLHNTYKINPEDFKLEDGKYQGYFLAPEIMDLLVLLLGSIKKNPIIRKNTALENVAASALADYNKSLINGIENNIHEEFKEKIYCESSYLNACQIADWTEPLIIQLVRFIIISTELESGNIGAIIQEFTKKLDDMNFNLFVKKFFYENIRENEIENFCKIYGINIEDFQKKREQILVYENQRLDILISNMLNRQLNIVKQIKSTTEPEKFKEYYAHKFGCSKKNKVFEEFTKERLSNNEGLRDLYYNNFIKDNGLDAKYKIEMNVMNTYKRKTASWKSREDQIREGVDVLVEQNSVDERIRHLEREIEKYKTHIRILKYQKKNLEKTNSIDDIIDFSKKMQDEYLSYCEKLDSKNDELKRKVNKFLGQVLLELS